MSRINTSEQLQRLESMHKAWLAKTKCKAPHRWNLWAHMEAVKEKLHREVQQQNERQSAKHIDSFINEELRRRLETAAKANRGVNIKASDVHRYIA